MSLTKRKGVINFNGHFEKWYSQKVLPGKGLKIPGRHVDPDSGVIKDEDGYVCVATQLVDEGEIIETSLGTGKRYDYCSEPNTVDIYTDW